MAKPGPTPRHQAHEGCILLFVRLPEPGRVKTRLAETLGRKETAALYDAFVRDMLDGLERVPAHLRVCVHPGDALDAARQWLGPHLDIAPQQGADLGERMDAALRGAFADGFSRAVLLGSDVPDFPPALVEKALADLHVRPAAVGPAMDGGYYLIGFHHEALTPEASGLLFQDMPWGTGRVYELTRRRMQALGLDPAVLPEWNDVDAVRDLNVLFRLNRNSSFRASRTFALLREREDLLRAYDVDLPTRPGFESEAGDDTGGAP
jgi:hypothetical protein